MVTRNEENFMMTAMQKTPFNHSIMTFYIVRKMMETVEQISVRADDHHYYDYDYDYDENAERKNDSVQEVRQTESGLTEGLWC